ncbi:MAG: deoxyribose-phosphate aldolase [Thermotogota bacterium]|nr:deoxyribose-phosphate aldolase [Thermotogota bacterium]
MNVEEIAKMIDHSLLKPELTKEDIEKGCKLAMNYDVMSVCVRPCDIDFASGLLKKSTVKVTTVIGFPHGANITLTKVYEAESAIERGAVELDMVLNIGRLLSLDYEYVEKDIKNVTSLAHEKDVLVKVILENCYLTDELIKKACLIAERANADFVKTSTGFGSGGAEIKDVKLMRDTVSESVKVKAAGGVRTLDRLIEMKNAGASRIGATATRKILEDAKKRETQGIL